MLKIFISVIIVLLLFSLLAAQCGGGPAVEKVVTAEVEKTGEVETEEEEAPAESATPAVEAEAIALAPDFTLPDSQGNNVNLAKERRTHNVVLIFYYNHT